MPAAQFVLENAEQWEGSCDIRTHKSAGDSNNTEPDFRKMIIARLVERIEVGADYSVKIRLRINMKQYTGDVA